jgi:aspartate/methionine/tyrosine aminotransferase
LHQAPDLKDRVVVVNGASKTYSMTGWRIGWALGNEFIIRAMSNYQSQTTSCAAPFTQAAVVAALQAGDSEVEKNVVKLRERAEFFVKGLNKISGWKAWPPQGAFYIWADVRGLIGKTFAGSKLNSDADVATALLDAERVAVVPGGESGVPGYLRLSFALAETDLQEAVKRIERFTAALTKT